MAPLCPTLYGDVRCGIACAGEATPLYRVGSTSGARLSRSALTLSLHDSDRKLTLGHLAHLRRDGCRDAEPRQCAANQATRIFNVERRHLLRGRLLVRRRRASREHWVRVVLQHEDTLRASAHACTTQNESAHAPLGAVCWEKTRRHAPDCWFVACRSACDRPPSRSPCR